MKTIPPLAAIIFDFTILQRIHNYPKADGIQLPTGPRALGPGPTMNENNAPSCSNYPRLHKAPNNSQLSKSGYYSKKSLKQILPSTAAILLDFTKLQPVNNYPGADASKKGLPVYSSNSPRGF